MPPGHAARPALWVHRLRKSILQQLTVCRSAASVQISTDAGHNTVLSKSGEEVWECGLSIHPYGIFSKLSHTEVSVAWAAFAAGM